MVDTLSSLFQTDMEVDNTPLLPDGADMELGTTDAYFSSDETSTIRLKRRDWSSWEPTGRSNIFSKTKYSTAFPHTKSIRITNTRR